MSSSANASGADRIAAAIRRESGRGWPAIVAYLTAGYPQRARFRTDLAAVAAGADVVEVGVPFSDPMADGATIQRASRGALEQGVSLRWILSELGEVGGDLPAPIVLMSYLNPVLSMGIREFASRAASSGVSGLIVPDLPMEESAEIRAELAERGLALVPMVTPITHPGRAGAICRGARGFVYAVTVAGVTGGERSGVTAAVLAEYLGRLRAASAVPVCAGFGIRRAEQVAELAGHADGVVVGSEIVEQLERGVDVAAFLRGLRRPE